MNINEKCLIVWGRSHHVTMHGISAKSAPWHETETQMRGGLVREEESRHGFVLVQWEMSCDILINSSLEILKKTN